MTPRLLPFVLALTILLPFSSGSLTAMELIMFEQQDCEWCEVWHKEIGPVYPKTTEGKMAPLRQVDIFDERPADIKKLNAGHFTPTFVLMDKDKEIGRIRGYPGEDFFWGMLGELIAKQQKKVQLQNASKS